MDGHPNGDKSYASNNENLYQKNIHSSCELPPHERIPELRVSPGGGEPSNGNDLGSSYLGDMYDMPVLPMRITLPNPKRSLLPSDKPFPCDICGKKFARVNALQNHKKIHSAHAAAADAAVPLDEKPFLYDINSGLAAPPSHHHHYLHPSHSPHHSLTTPLSRDLIEMHKIAYERMQTAAATAAAAIGGGGVGTDQKFHPCADLYTSSATSTQSLSTHRGGHRHHFHHHLDLAALRNTTALPLAAQTDTHHSSSSSSSSLDTNGYKSANGASSLSSVTRLGGPEKPFVCDLCNKRFARRDTLQCHKRTHGGEKPFECDTCGKRFSRRDKLQCHIRVHSGERPFPCAICGKAFAQSDKLKCHLRTHTGERPHPCDICPLRFARRDTLHCHRRTHTGEKPFGCTTCGKRFARRDKLTCHNRVHSGEKPFGCAHCGKQFARSDKLQRHKRTHAAAAAAAAASNTNNNIVINGQMTTTKTQLGGGGPPLSTTTNSLNGGSLLENLSPSTKVLFPQQGHPPVFPTLKEYAPVGNSFWQAIYS